MNGPCAVCWACAPGMPMAAGIWRATPFTKTVRCAWMWNSVCSLAWQPMPSTVWPVADPVALASGWAAGIGTPSGPVAPAAGAGLSVPSVLSADSLSDGPDEPPVTARVMPTAAAATTTSAAAPVSHRRRFLRRASSARWRAIRSFARSRFLSLLAITPIPHRPETLRARRAGAGCVRGLGADGRHRGPHDAGVVEQGRGHDPGPDAGQPRHPLVGLLADAAAHDDQARPQHRLDVLEVLIHASGPLAPAHVVEFLGALGGTRLGVAATDLDVPELGVRHQDAPDEQRTADAGAEG